MISRMHPLTHSILAPPNSPLFHPLLFNLYGQFPAKKLIDLKNSVLDLSYDLHEIPNPYPVAKEGVSYEWADRHVSKFDDNDIQHDLFVLYSRLNLHDHEEKHVEFLMEEEGLGTLPPEISSVGSLLLFNSDVNPYKKYEARDNLMSAGRTREFADGKEELHDAPKSLVDGDALPDVMGLDLTFKPKVESVSGFSAPSDLPLDFLADIRFEADLPSISPSAGQIDLPAPQTLSRVPVGQRSASSSSANTLAAAASPPPPPPGNGVQPPPPPPPAQQQQQEEQQQQQPPPPPPPQPSAVSQRAEDDKEQQPLPPQPEVGTNDMKVDADEDGPTDSHGPVSFLDQIKQMDVSKLRSREEADMKATRKSKTTAAAKKDEPMSMRDELMSRLKRRAGVFSGKSDKASTKRDSIIVKNSTAEAGGGRALPKLRGDVNEDDDEDGDDGDGGLGGHCTDDDDDDDDDDDSDDSDLSIDDPMEHRSLVPKATSEATSRKAAKTILPPRPKFEASEEATNGEDIKRRQQGPSKAPEKRQSMYEASMDEKSSLSAMMKGAVTRSESEGDDNSEDSDWDD